MPRLTTLGFDADDTLWHNERFFHLTQKRFFALLAPHVAPELAGHLAEHLLAAERRNIRHYGFGIKGFVLSMIETALDVTGESLPPAVIREILEAGREMLAHPIELLAGARPCLEALQGYRLVLITKGDLLDQERKLAQSGLGALFDAIEIVSDKTPEVYAKIFARHGTGAQEGLMVGNSMKSDVLPMIAAGGHGVFIPAELGWALEEAPAPQHEPRYHQLGALDALPALVAQITQG